MNRNHFKEIYNKYINLLKEIPDDIDKERIEVSKTSKGNKFYSIQKGENECIRKYIKPEDTKEISRLAQKRYLNHIRRELKSKLPILKRISTYDFKDIGEIYSELNPALKKYVTPIVPSWEKTLNDWKNTSYITNSKKFYGEMYTKSGIKVRSKSEKIIADLLYDHSVVFKYECPIKNRGRFYYPSFTFLSKRTGQEIYWEHFGLLDDEAYRNSMVRKIKSYSKMGLIVGKNLIITFENKLHPIERDYIDSIINEYLIKEVR